MALFRRVRSDKRRLSRREWARRQLRRIAILPSLMTLANGVFGMAAIHAVTNYNLANYSMWGVADGFLLATVFLILAMLCDMLDGRIARFTRQTTDFGGQLDSLSDVVSFGVAPAILVYHMVIHDLDAVGGTSRLAGDFQFVAGSAGRMIGRFTWLAGAAYFSCAALRLARFNVENVHDESAHLWFKGLPSPGAAAGVMALALLHHTVWADADAPAWLRLMLAIAMPVYTLTLGLLMVSTYRYPHIINQYLTRKRSFAHLAKMALFTLLIIVFVMLTAFEYAIAAVVVAYTLSGAVSGLSRQLRGLPAVPPAATAPVAAIAPTAPSAPPVEPQPAVVSGPSVQASPPQDPADPGRT